MHPQWKRFCRLAFGVALLGGQISCGQEQERTTPAEVSPAGPPPSQPAGQPPADQATPAVMVEMTRSDRFYPEVVVIRPGDTVEWINNSDQIHTVTNDPASAVHPDNVTAPTSASRFDSGYIEPGKTYRVRFTQEGEYRYVCFLHETQGMTGTILVTSKPGP
jgi:plastocyanin